MKRIGIGYENYKDFIDQDLYYVDKTLLVRDVLRIGGKATLLTRPRRFGKTLGLSMLQTFFELEYDRHGDAVDKSHYFSGMKIMSCGNDILAKMGKYPVIKLSLKGAKQTSFAEAFIALRREIIREFARHGYLADSEILTDIERENFYGFLRGNLEWEEEEKKFKNIEERNAAIRRECEKYADSLKLLCEFLEKHHGIRTIILLDEYDVPLENAWTAGFYGEMVSFIRSLFEATLKTNDALEFAIITGCLRISRESIFTGMNNLEAFSIRSSGFSKGFGFTEEDVSEMLEYYHLESKADEIKEWYDGYLFGSTEIYNPWSLTNYVKAQFLGPGSFPEAYWSNTSSNAIVRKLIYRADAGIKEDLDVLMGGGTIEKRIHEDITYADVSESDDNLWNFLFFTGYMRKASERMVGTDIYIRLCIPNQEIACIYRDQIREWFDKSLANTDRSKLYAAVLARDANTIKNFLNVLLERSISTFDSAEAFYHGFLLSMLIDMPSYGARSNREEGNGRPDVVLYPRRPKDPAFIFEVKIRKKYSEMEDGLREAFAQIEMQRYEEGVLDDGYAGVASYGICFCKKSCIVGLFSRS